MDEIEQQLEEMYGALLGAFTSARQFDTPLHTETIKDMVRYLVRKGFGKQNSWIPVSERVPEIDQKVLIYTKTEIITCGWYTEAHGLAYNKGFETENGFMWLATASHWMPLPGPPAEYSDCELERRKNE